MYFGALEPSLVKVELYASPVNGGEAERIPMARAEKIPGALNGFIYRCQAPAARPSEHYTPRIVPEHIEAIVPLEESHILWQK